MKLIIDNSSYNVPESVMYEISQRIIDIRMCLDPSEQTDLKHAFVSYLRELQHTNISEPAIVIFTGLLESKPHPKIIPLSDLFK